METTSAGVPKVLAAGGCIELWAEDGAVFVQEDGAVFAPFSAMRRYGAARTPWLGAAGIGDREGEQLLPFSAPWSADFLTANGHGDQVKERFARAGCSVDDIQRLRLAAESFIPDRPRNPRTAHP